MEGWKGEIATKQQSSNDTETRLLVGWLAAYVLQHASVLQWRICLDYFTCCHSQTEAEDQTCYLTKSFSADIGPTSPSTDPLTPGA